MSNTTKWVIGIVIVAAVILGLWRGGFFGGGKRATNDAQSAAALKTAGDKAAPVDVSDATIAQESAAIDAQVRVSGSQFAAFSQAPTVAKADLLAGQFGGISNLMTKLANRIQTRVNILASMGFDTKALQGPLSDMNLQVSYAVSQIGVAGQAAAKIKPENGSAAQANINSAAIQQMVIELQKPQGYLEAAQKDIKAIIAAFKALNTSQRPSR
ncbi:MAG: hypothetical protein HYV67_04770 [Candidatus Taylorbacteria bacterium]|nr:hypothetical protein [Candidatus Taylorbacteria bacterium]